MCSKKRLSFINEINMAEMQTMIILMKKVKPAILCNFLPFWETMANNPETNAVKPDKM